MPQPLTFAIPAEQLNAVGYGFSGQGSDLIVLSKSQLILMPLFPWHIQLTKPPQDIAILGLDEFQKLAVVQKQFGPLEQYMLFNLASGELIPWQSSRQQDGQLILEPEPLAPGAYLFVVTTDSMYGGQTFYYFQLT